MHWHEDLQFIYVLDGEIDVKILDALVKLSKGGGIFINKNIIHLVSKTASGHYNSFIFPDYFLVFYFGSPAKTFVDYIVGKEELPICYFSNEAEWCKPILTIFPSLPDSKTEN